MNKTETALLYFPDSTPKVAVRHLMRWIARCAPLLHALYNPQIEMFARFKMKSSFHKTKRII